MVRTSMFARASAGLLCATGLCLAAPNPPAAAVATNTESRLATTDELATLTSALERTAADLRRWAYTESRVVRDEKGKVKSDVLLRYDPSQPYADQWTPLAINGKPPTASDRQKYRRMGERAQRREEEASSSRRKSLGEVIELNTAKIMRESAQALVFEVPLKKDGNDRFPPEKFQVLVQVNRATKGLENIAVRLRGSFRTKLIVKVKSGEGTLEFTVVDSQHPPTLTSIVGDASASVLFISVGGQLELKRTEIKHVKPYDERFEVKIGTLKAIDF